MSEPTKIPTQSSDQRWGSRITAIIPLFFFLATAGHAATYYVSPTGNNSNNGLSPTTAFATPQRAADAASTPGDTVIVADGNYPSFTISWSGEEGREIRYISQNRWGAKIVGGEENNGIGVGANHIGIEGFDVTAGQHGIVAENQHHITVRNCHTHDCGNSGISMGHNPNTDWAPSDYYLIEKNVSHHNARKSWYSGISIYEAIEYDQAPGYHIIVRGNVCHDNFTYDGAHTDGNGIIIDDWNFTQHEQFLAEPGTPYSLGALVENNLCYDNGGAGIKVVWSDNIVVRNNTVYGNNRDPLDTGTFRGGFYVDQARGCKFINNIACGDRSANTNNSALMDHGAPSGNVTAANLWIFNLTFMGSPGDGGIDTGDDNSSIFSANLLGVDPSFADLAARDFHTVSGSPAANAGTSLGGTAESGTDLDGSPRVSGFEIDIGAYEFQSPPIHVPVEGLSVSPAAIDLLAGDQSILGVAYAPFDTDEREVEWATSTPGVATVSPEGVVTACAPGVAILTLRSSTNAALLARCTVSVTPPVPVSATIEAESFAARSSGLSAWNTGIGDTSGNWAKYTGVDFAILPAEWRVRLATPLSGTLELRLGSTTGTLLSTLNFTPTGGWDNYREFSAPLGNISGVQDIVLAGVAGTANIDSFSFTGGPGMTYAAWLSKYFTPQEIADTGIGGPSANPDGDQLSNLLEYAFATDPRTANAPTLTPLLEGEPSRWKIHFYRARGDIRYEVQFSRDLAVWESVPDPGETGTNVLVEDPSPPPAGISSFVRLKVDLH